VQKKKIKKKGEGSERVVQSKKSKNIVSLLKSISILFEEGARFVVESC
jgi:hypothetical protein